MFTIYRLPRGVLVVVALLFMGCAARSSALRPGSSGGDLRQTPLAVRPSEDAVSTWVRYHSFLSAVVNGALYDQWQLQKTVAFFEIVSGIPSELDGTALGLILNYETLRSDMQRWDAWYSANKSPIDLAKVAMQLPYPEQP